MKYKLSVIVTLLLFIANNAYSASIFARESIGIVDFNAIVMLHPAMVDYEPAKETFKTIRAKSSANAVNEQKEAMADELRKLKYEDGVLNAKLDELRNRHMNEYEKIKQNFYKIMSPDNNLATGTRINEEKKFENSIKTVDEKYKNLILETETRLASIHTRLEYLESSPNIELNLTPEETKQKFAAIIQEVNQTIKYIADKHGMSIVLNSSSERWTRSNQQNDTKSFPGDISYKGILYAQYLPSYDAHQNDPVTKYYNDIHSQTRYWLYNERKVLGKNYSQLPSGSILLGGSNITKEVLLTIFKKYKINDNIARAIADSIY